MSSKQREHDEIIAEAREKYTVHHCGQCDFRKSCNLDENGFDSDECKERRQSIMLGFGIEDGYFTKLLDRLEAAHKRDIAEIGRPLRNCDVGTPEEQYLRFKKWCESEFYKRPMNALTGEPCKSCPCYVVSASGVDGCNYLRWAQMPYVEGGAK